MQSLRDAMVLAILILLALTVRIDAVDRATDGAEGLHASEAGVSAGEAPGGGAAARGTAAPREFPMPGAAPSEMQPNRSDAGLPASRRAGMGTLSFGAGMGTLSFG
jgi:hypothetical protein